MEPNIDPASEENTFETSDSKEDETELPEVNELADENLKNEFGE